MMRWLQGVFHSRVIEKRLDAELRFHLEQQTAENIAAGMSPEEAYRRAQIEMGGVEQVRQKCRERRWGNHLEGVFRDVRFAMRRLAKDPRLSLTAILALGLGIGSTTLVFSLVYSLLLQPFPYRNFRRSTVFQIHDMSQAGNGGRGVFSIPEFLAFQQENQVFEDLVGYNNAINVSYDDGRGTREIFGEHGSESHAGAGGAYVTGNTFDYFGVNPLLGRGIAKGDGSPGAPPIFVMNYTLWQEMFHGDPKILGKSFLLNGEPRTLVGIMPPRFQIYGAGVWLPIGLENNAPEISEGLHAIGLLKPGISLEAAAADLTGIARGLAKVYPGKYPARFTVTAETFADSLFRRFKTTLYALIAAVLMLLLIACTNVANLLLARATARQGEIALRASLGASRSRLIQQLLVEALVLAWAGCILGCLLAYGSLKWFVALIPAHRIPDGVEFHLNATVLIFAIAISVVTTLLCGLAPALHAVGRNLQTRLAGFGRGSEGGTGLGALRTGLVIAEVAISIILLTGAGLMMRSFFALAHVDLGFVPSSVLYMRLNLPKDRYAGARARQVLLQKILKRIEALPGIRAATETWSLPPLDFKIGPVTVPGKTHSEEWDAILDACSSGYFQTLGLRLQRGRLFSETDVASARRVAVINQTLARRFFGKQDPIGQKIKFNALDKMPDTPHGAYFEIVGIVADFRNTGPQRQIAPEALVPYTVSPLAVPPNFLARTGLDPSSMLNSVFHAVWAVDPEVGIDMSGSLEDLLNEYVYQEPRFEFVTLGAFAGIGLLLIIVGVYGVTAYMVELRTHEIGVRTALGAQPGAIVRLVLKSGVRMIAAGVFLGLVVSLGVTRFLASQLWGISTTDPWTYAAVVTSVVAAGLAACFIPARRAAHVDPLITLRSE